MSSFTYRGSLCFLVVAVLGIAAASCRKSDHYCPGAPLDNCNYLDAIGRCASNDDCSEPAAICDVEGSKTCVQCLAPDQTSACGGTTPACRDNSCQACIAHAECDSSACQPDGSCGDDASVAYVDPAGTDNASCTKAMPCTLVSKALATNRPYIKFTGTTDEAVTIDSGRVITFLAEPGAKLTRTNGIGAIVTVEGDGTSLTIYDLSISDAPNNSSGIGIVIPTAMGAPRVTLTRAKVTNNPGGGISAAAGTLTVSQSTISKNTGGGISAGGGTLTVSQSKISENIGGGISVTNGAFVIVGNVFVNNGNDTLPVGGGIAISTPQNATNRLEFNSFTRNKAQDTLGTAIHCIAGTFTARNNIMSGNGTMSNMNQVGGNCMHAYSIVRPGTIPPGTGNSGGDPLFKDTTAGDLHVTAGSPALGAADPNSNLTGPAERDIDGDVRTSPADIGADEVP